MSESVRPGAIVMFGSGETAAVGREALRWLRASGRAPEAVAVLETPAGFEPNAEDVAARWTRFLRRQPELRGARFAQVAARRRGTPQSPDEPEVVRPILSADLVVLGAGSPSYAVRQLRDSLAWEHAHAAHLLGASLFLASAAAIAAGTCALPVYEIYKVGEDLHWNDGLRLFEPYALTLSVMTHWDNADGGPTLDTSRTYMGETRYRELLGLLPRGVVVVGIDEHTALAMDPATAEARILGRGEVTVVRDGRETVHATGTTFALSELGPFALPGGDALRSDARDAITAARAEDRSKRPPEEIGALVAERARARAARDFATADRLRAQIAERGWDVEDIGTVTRVLPRRST